MLPIVLRQLASRNQFSVAPDAVKAKMLQEINRELDMLAREERYNADVQEPPEVINCRRTYGKGG